MNVITWFDPIDKDHIKAANCYLRTSKWPDDFFPKELEFPEDWENKLLKKILLFYVQVFLNDELIITPKILQDEWRSRLGPIS